MIYDGSLVILLVDEEEVVIGLVLEMRSVFIRDYHWMGGDVQLTLLSATMDSAATGSTAAAASSCARYQSL